ncbi:MAG: hypothetical protein VXY93_16855, partial [Pseudomonadota bacterium]|nr:hypothetical protein [Pseudomonadota bacterium]
GADNQLTLHTNNTTEAVKLDTAGNLHFHNHLNISGVSSASNFKTGSTNVHSTGVELANINTGGGTATFGGGITVAGAIDANGDLDVDGHSNLDNVSIAGVTTTTENIHIKADNKQLKIGAHNDGDTLLYHDGNKSVLVNYTGDFHIRTNNGSRSSLEGIILKPNGATEIYHSGSKIIETDSLGINVLGRLDVSGTGANDHLNVDSNTTRLRIGGYADLQIYHDS